MNSLIVLSAILVAAYAATSNPMLVALHKAFGEVDFNKDGHLSVAEFQRMYDHYDVNHDGHLYLDEYISVTHDQKQNVQPTWNFYDTNHDGDIPRSEVTRIFNLYDHNNNGMVTFHEFLNYVQKLGARFATKSPVVG